MLFHIMIDSLVIKQLKPFFFSGPALGRSINAGKLDAMITPDAPLPELRFFLMCHWARSGKDNEL